MSALATVRVTFSALSGAIVFAVKPEGQAPIDGTSVKHEQNGTHLQNSPLMFGMPSPDMSVGPQAHSVRMAHASLALRGARVSFQLLIVQDRGLRRVLARKLRSRLIHSSGRS